MVRHYGSITTDDGEEPMATINTSHRQEHTGYRESAARIGDIPLEGILVLPTAAKGIVLFAHGSGSSRFSPRNNMVAGGLQEAGIGTLLFDLLTEAEATNRANVFDVPLLAERLLAAAAWLDENDGTRAMPVGYFGASTGAAAALIAASRSSRPIAAVVSRGGRPDLAQAVLDQVKSPTLLIVGGYDSEVLALNRAAFEQLQCEKALEVVPGATHLFEEPGALEKVTRLAAQWFARHLGSAAEGCH
jgi:dienelactone hydrolase